MIVALRSVLILTQRNLLATWRRPTYLLTEIIVQPVTFVLLFVYVFGGAIQIPGTSYVDYLLPGILVQTAGFGGLNTGIALTGDLKSGLMDRFWSLAMSRFSVVVARVITDTIFAGVGIVLMLGVGALAGFRFHGDLGADAAAVVVAMAFAFAMAWLGALLGVAARTPETVQAMGFVVLFPLMFASSVFVPVATMPSWLQVVAERTPITAAVDTARHLVLAWPLGGEVLAAAVWIAVMFVVSCGGALFFYRRLMA
jgi:ABC transporter DrrB family efflux protein